MQKNTLRYLSVLGLVALTACQLYDPTPHPDYAIRVTPTIQGGIATPPECPSWSKEVIDPYDNQPPPQYGCADARNLAMTVETPNDLVLPRDLGPMRGVEAVGAMRRYDNNQTRGLIHPGTEDNQAAVTTASSGASSLSGDITGGASSGSSSSAASASAAASP